MAQRWVPDARPPRRAQIKKRLVVAQPSYVIKVVDREGTRVVSSVGGAGAAPSAA